MFAEQPEISRLRHRRRGLVQRRQIILFVVAGACEGDVDLAHLKAADAKVDLAADLQNVGELQLQRINIPARVLAKPVEREPQHPQFGLVEVGNGHGGDFNQAGGESAVFWNDVDSGAELIDVDMAGCRAVGCKPNDEAS